MNDIDPEIFELLKEHGMDLMGIKLDCTTSDEKALQATYIHDVLIHFGQVLTERKRAWEAGRWIPVTERLPEDERDVLALLPDGTCLVAQNARCVGWWDAEFNSCWPTHWRELPAVPQKEPTR
jgi:hypothetical protein